METTEKSCYVVSFANEMFESNLHANFVFGEVKTLFDHLTHNGKFKMYHLDGEEEFEVNGENVDSVFSTEREVKIFVNTGRTELYEFLGRAGEERPSFYIVRRNKLY